MPDDQPTRDRGQRLLHRCRAALPRVSQWVVAAALLAVVIPKLTSLQAPDLSAIREPGWLVLAVGAESLSILCAFVQQRCSVSYSSHRVGWRRLGRVTLAATAIGYVVPGGPTVAGFYCARRYRASGVGQEEAAGGQFLVCLVTAVAAGAMGLAGVVLGSSGEFAKRFPPSLWTGAGWLCAFLLVGGVLGLVVLRLPRLHRWLASSRLLGRLLGCPTGPADRLRPGEAPMHRLGVVALAVGSALGILVFDLLSLLAALTAFGVHVTTATVVTAYAVVALVSLVPVTPGGLGLVEGGLFALLLVRGVPAASLMAGVLTYRLVSYWLVVLMGGVALVSERVVSARARPLAEDAPGPLTIDAPGPLTKDAPGRPAERAPGRLVEHAPGRLVEHAPGSLAEDASALPAHRLRLGTVQRRAELPRQSQPQSALPH